MKYTVHLMTAYCSWEDIEAKSEAEAIEKVQYPPEFDCNDQHTFVAIEE
jgi:hypothetical protein